MTTPLKALIAFLGLLATVALAQSVTSKTFGPGFTEPTLASDGVPLDGKQGWHVIASADAGSTFQGTGTLACRYYGSVFSTGMSGAAITKRWMPCSSTFNVAPVAGQRDVVSADYNTSVGSGRVYYLPSAVGVVLPDAGVVDGGIYITIETRAVK